ncbi:MAG TPA: SurA N-terminal domain-containing protein [Desulfuromonadales bacterium]|nr:SurA N-terminal domain-containing protein [Desulfuromonadales bacterium]
MLDLIRKKQKSVIVQVVFWTIIAAFVGTIFLVWGKGGSGGRGDASTAVTVNGTRISFDDYQSTYDELYRFYQNVYKGQFSRDVQKKLHLQQQALNTVVEQALFLQEAGRQGLSVSHDELIDAIAHIPAFQVNGAFSKGQYLRALDYQHLTPDAFEKMEKNQLLVNKVRQKVISGVKVTDQDIDKAYRNQNEKIDLSFVAVPPQQFNSRVKVTEADLKKFFDKHSEDYRIPAKIAISYIKFTPAHYLDKVKVTDAELQKYYDQHEDLYAVPEQMSVSHLLIRVDADASAALRNKKKALAEKLRDEAANGKDFAQLVRRYSDDAATVTKGGNLGFLKRRSLPEALAKAIFALHPGEISKVVTTPAGFEIFKAEKHIEGGLKSFSQVKGQVTAGLKAEKAHDMAVDRAMTAYSANRDSANLEKAAKDSGLSVETSGFFSRGEAIPQLGDAPSINAAVFSLENGRFARPVILPQGIYLFKIKDRKASRIPKLSEVKTKVEQDYRASMAKDLAKQAAIKILAGAKAGKSLVKAALGEGLSVKSTGFFTRAAGAYIPHIGTSKDLANEAFNLTSAKPVAPEVYTVDDTDIVAVLKDRQDADMKKLDKAMRLQLRQSLLSKKQNEALDKMVAGLKAKAKISISQTLQSKLEEE